MTTARAKQRQQAERRRLLKVLAIAVLTGIAVLGLNWGWVQIHRPDLMPLSRVAVKGDLTAERRDQLEAVVTLAVSGNFFTLDIDAVRRAATSLSWVESTSVTREWPDGLLIKVEERKPFARWDDEQLVSLDGEVFQAVDPSRYAALPHLLGPRERGSEVVSRFHEFQIITGAAGLGLVDLRLDERAGWTLWLDSGHRIALGGEGATQRLERALRVLEAAGERAGAIEHMDARYSNGVAVTWRPIETDEALASRDSRS